jgi:IclR family KDG regulon transcriptional repressor
MPKKSDNPYVVQPVMKALRVLELVARHGHEIALTTVGRELMIPKTTTFRYLQTLTEAGFLNHNRETDKYTLGPLLRSIASADASVSKVRQLARPAMIELMTEFNETVNLAVKGNGTIVYIDLVEANRSLRMQARIGDSHPMHSTALGKAILAFLPDTEKQRQLEQPLTERTGRTLLEREEIERQLRQTAKLGYATEVGENEDGAMCIGVPIFDADRYPIAALSISAPLMRMPRALAAKAGRRLCEVAGRISAHFGSQDPAIPV